MSKLSKAEYDLLLFNVFLNQWKHKQLIIDKIVKGLDAYVRL